jgi:hypothetical protein
VVKLKERLSSMGVTSKEMRSLPKAGLIDLLFVKLRAAEEKEQSYQNMKKKQNETVLESRESYHKKEKLTI